MRVVRGRVSRDEKRLCRGQGHAVGVVSKDEKTSSFRVRGVWKPRVVPLCMMLPFFVVSQVNFSRFFSALGFGKCFFFIVFVKKGKVLRILQCLALYLCIVIHTALFRLEESPE